MVHFKEKDTIICLGRIKGVFVVYAVVDDCCALQSLSRQVLLGTI
jgi:hypothetical protein